MGARLVKLGQISIDLLDLFNNGTALQKQKITDLLKRTSNCDYKTQVLGGLTPVNTTQNPDTLYSVIWNEVRRNTGLSIQLPPCYRYQFNADSLPYGMSSQYLGESGNYVQLQFNGSAFKDPTWYEQVDPGTTTGYAPRQTNEPVLKAFFPDTTQTSEHIVNVHLNLGFTGGGRLVPISSADLPNYDPRTELSFTIRARLSHSSIGSSQETLVDMYTGSITYAQIAAGEAIPVHAHMRMMQNGGYPYPLTIDGQELIGNYNQLEVFLVQDQIGAIVPVVNSAGATTGSRSGALNMIKAAPVTSDMRDSSNYAEVIKLLV